MADDPVALLQRSLDAFQQRLDKVMGQLARLDSQRVELENTVARLTDMLSTMEPVVASGKHHTTTFYYLKDPERDITSAFREHVSGESVRTVVMEILKGADRPVRMADLIGYVKARGIDAKDASIRSVVSKLASDGVIYKPDRGLYSMPADVELPPVDETSALDAAQSPDLVPMTFFGGNKHYVTAGPPGAIESGRKEVTDE